MIYVPTPPSIKGVFAWVGTWIAGLLVGEFIFEIKTFIYICAYGVAVFWIAEIVEAWMVLPKKIR
jgi:hypothetical protein